MVQVVKLGVKRPVTRPLLPDPAPRPIRYTIISADDHLMEPAHTFEGRLPKKLQDCIEPLIHSQPFPVTKAMRREQLVYTVKRF